tara:strand:- start:102370 stop:103668 length:1299 start_codon:yes stop_codon:yes gene_type:complete
MYHLFVRVKPNILGDRALRSSGERQYRLDTNARFSTGQNTWTMMVMGVATGLLGTYFMVARPMLSQINHLQTELVAVQQDMDKLVGAKTSAWQVNNLLSVLNSQANQLTHAQSAVAEIRDLRILLEKESAKTEQALVAFQKVSDFQKRVVQQDGLTSKARMTLDEMLAMQDQLASQTAQTKLTHSTLEEMVKLQKMAMDQSTGIKDAKTAFNEFTQFKQQIVDQSQQLDAARENSKKMIALQDTLVAQTEPIAAAQKTTQQLISLQETLTNEDVKVAEAGTNLQSLMTIQAKLLAETGRVVDAVETLEVLGDLQDRVQEQVASMKGMRRELLDIVLMESTVAKATKILGPLAELGNLSRLSDAEVREAARVIMDQRDTRMGKNSPQFRRIQRDQLPSRTSKLMLDGNPVFHEDSNSSGLADKLVPTPPAEEE